MLDGLGLIEMTEEENVRGSVAHFYKAVNRPLIQSSDWAQLDPKVRNSISGHLLEGLMIDAAVSLATGYFDKRKDRHASHTPLLLDETGWRAVVAIQANALRCILEEQTAAAGRMEGSVAGIPAVLGMFCFELPGDLER